MKRYIIHKTDFPYEWYIYDTKTKRAAFGWNPQQALKRVKSDVCKRWYVRHQKAQKTFGKSMMCWRGHGHQWEWDQIFKTTQGHPFWDPFLSRYYNNVDKTRSGSERTS